MPAHALVAGFFQFFQTFEYARGFLWRYTWMQYDMLVLISGAFAGYRKSVLETAGGFDTASWVEDYELTHRVYRDCYDRGEHVHVQTHLRRPGHHRFPCQPSRASSINGGAGLRASSPRTSSTTTWWAIAATATWAAT